MFNQILKQLKEVKSMIDKSVLIAPADALPGRSQCLAVPEQHYVNHNSMLGNNGQLDLPKGCQQAMFGLGCFWGAERKFWELPGVYLTAVGYAGGSTPNPSYEEVCSGLTGHNEVVAVVFDPQRVSYQQLLTVFWASHNPTQGMRQGNDRGTQYRSGIYTYDDQQAEASLSMSNFQMQLTDAGFGSITTEIISAPIFYFAEGYHQQYLAKNPGGYCGLGGLGVMYQA